MKICAACKAFCEEDAGFCDACGNPLDVHATRTVVVGRSPQAELVLDDPGVSWMHAAVTLAGDGLLVRDLGSSNGTYVNDAQKKIVGPTVVKRNDTLLIGQHPVPVASLMDLLHNRPLKAASLETGASYVIGRDLQADLVIDVPAVSRRHVAVSKVADGWAVRDLGSANGTFINSVSHALTGTEIVGPRDVLLLGTYRLPVPFLSERLASRSRVSEAKKVVLLDDAPVVLGRAGDCDVVLPYPQISGRHARLTRLGVNTLLVEDLGSRNGTFVDGKRVTQMRTSLGSRISLGSVPVLITVEGNVEASPLRGSVRLDAIGLCRTGKHRSTGQPITLLDNINLSIYPSELIALMGSSGAGKTSLMQVLCGDDAPDAGQLLINGDDFFQHFDRFRSVIGYVPQDDILHKELTVREALYYTARMRLPPDTTGQEIEERIHRTLADLNLTEQRDQVIGSVDKKILSGGQRKRVNLGLELIADPEILFLDEPTSGLSSKDTADLIGVLRKLVDRGRTVVLTIHQPSREVYQKMDHVLCMARGGRVAFFGPPQPDSYQYFGVNDQSPDSVVAALDSQSAEHWQEQFRASQYYVQYVEQRQPDSSAGQEAPPAKPARRSSRFWSQFATLLSRYYKIKKRDVSNLCFLAIQAPGVGLLVGLMFKSVSDVTMPLFIMAVSTIFFGCLNACKEIVAERTIFRRERRASLQVWPYLLSKFCLLGMLGVVQCAVFILILQQFIDLHARGVEMFGVLAVTSLASTAMGLMVSTLVTSENAAMAVTPLVLIAQITLSGIIAPLDSDWKKAIAAPMVSRWSFNALIDSEYRALPDEAVKVAFKVNTIDRAYLTTGRIDRDAAYIVSMMGIFLGVTAALMVWRSRIPQTRRSAGRSALGEKK